MGVFLGPTPVQIARLKKKLYKNLEGVLRLSGYHLLELEYLRSCSAWAMSWTTVGPCFDYRQGRELSAIQGVQTGSGT